MPDHGQAKAGRDAGLGISGYLWTVDFENME